MKRFLVVDLSLLSKASNPENHISINNTNPKCILGIPNLGLRIDFRGHFKLHVNYNEYINFIFLRREFHSSHYIHEVISAPQK